MNISANWPRYLVIFFTLTAVIFVVAKGFKPSTGNGQIAVKVPELTDEAKAGKRFFDGTCAACHGNNAAGSDKGPPLVHKIYEPSHHGDAAFFLAIRNGVRAHHWPFGNMPAQSHITEAQSKAIVRYIRELQRANGIY